MNDLCQKVTALLEWLQSNWINTLVQFIFSVPCNHWAHSVIFENVSITDEAYLAETS